MIGTHPIHRSQFTLVFFYFLLFTSSYLTNYFLNNKVFLIYLSLVLEYVGAVRTITVRLVINNTRFLLCAGEVSK